MEKINAFGMIGFGNQNINELMVALFSGRILALFIKEWYKFVTLISFIEIS